MITNTIWAQYGGSSTTSLMYSKPYTKGIDNMKMPNGYQGGLLVKQFVHSLKGNAFGWYTNLEPESINSWEQIKRDLLDRFYSMCHMVKMMELTNTKQRKNQPVVNYMSRQCYLSLDCKDRIYKICTVEMCIQSMHWRLLYILQRIKP